MASIIISDSGSENGEEEGEVFQPFSLYSRESSSNNSRSRRAEMTSTETTKTTTAPTNARKRGSKSVNTHSEKGSKRARQTEHHAKEKQRKKQQKDVDVAVKKVAALSHRDASNPSQRLKQMIVIIDSCLSENPDFMEPLLGVLREVKVQYRVTTGQAVQGSVRWKRRQYIRTVDDTAEISETVSEQDEPDLLVTLESQGLAGLVYNTTQVQQGHTLPPNSQTLIQYVESIQHSHPGVNISIAVKGMDALFRKKKTKVNRDFRKVVLGRSDTSTPAPYLTDALTAVSWVHCQEAIIGLELELCCGVRLCTSGEELAEYVLTLTKALAEKPFSAARMDSPFSFLPDAASGNKKKAQDSSDQLSVTWKHQLMQFNNMSECMAAAIVANYPTPSHLLTAYSACGSKSSAEVLLQDITVRRGVGSIASSRRIGPVQSRRVHCLLTSHDPHMIIT